MTNTRTWRLSAVIATASLLLALIMPALPTRALSSTTLTPSDPRPSEAGVTYTFDTSGVSGTLIRCIDLVLNTQADGAGSAVGTTTSYTLGTSTAITDTLWTEDTAVNGRMRATYATGEIAVDGNIVFENVTNGAAEGTTYYGIFTTYTDTGCTTPAAGVDSAIVAYVLKDGELVTLTIDPTLTFTCSPVASGTVNGATITAASTAFGIDHGNSVTSGVNGVSAHDLNVATNAPGGYTVYVRHTGQLTNGSLDTIDNLTGGATNAVPTTFTAAGVEGWGYTTEDSTLAGGTADRFTNPGNFWAPFGTTNEPVIDNTAAPVGTETTRVGHQVGVASTTPAGTYQTTIIYTVASVY